MLDTSDAFTEVCLTKAENDVLDLAVAPRTATQLRLPNRMQEVLTYIEDNLDVGGSLPELAEIANQSVFTFSRNFKKAYGVPPHAYIIHMRVRRVVKLLLTSALPISEIAYAVGFSSQSHMTTTVKKKTGATPGQIREAGLAQSCCSERAVHCPNPDPCLASPAVCSDCRLRRFGEGLLSRSPHCAAARN